MTGIWDDWYDQTAVIETYLGTGGNGKVYGPPVDVLCQIDDTVRFVRNTSAVEVVSSTTLLTPPGVVAPPQSKVTLPDGRKATVIITGTQHTDDDPDLTGLSVALT